MAAKNDSMMVRVFEGHSIGNHEPWISRNEFREVTLGTVKRWIKEYHGKLRIYGTCRDARGETGMGAITFSYYVNGCPNNHRFVIEPMD